MLASSSAEKPIRKLAQARIRTSDSLRRQYWLARGGWRVYLLTALVIGLAPVAGPIVVLALPAFAGGALAQCVNRADALSVVTVAAGCSLVVAIIHGNWLRRELTRSTSIALLGQLPISDRVYLRNRTCVSCGLTLLFLVVCLANVAGVVVTAPLDAAAVAAIIGLGILQWLIVVSLSVLIPIWLPLLGERLEGAAVSLGAACIAVSITLLMGQKAGVQDLLAIALKVVPTGWPLLMMYDAVLQPRPGAWWLCVPAGLLAAATLLSYFWFERRYIIREIVVEDGMIGVALGEEEVALSAAETPEPESEEQTRPQSPTVQLLSQLFRKTKEPDVPEVSPAEAAMRVRDGDFLDRDQWTDIGFIERLVGSVLSERERVVVEVMTAGKPGWTRSMLGGTLLATLVILLLLISDAIFPGRMIALGWQAAIFGIVFTLHNTWLSAIWKSADGHTCPSAALLPCKQTEVERVAMVLGTIRALCLLPYTIGMSLILFYGMNGQFEIARSLYLGIKVALIYVALHQWWFASIQLNASTPFPSAHWLTDLCVGGSAVILSLGGAVVLLFVAGESELWSLLATSALFGGGWLAQRNQRHRILNSPTDFVGANTESRSGSFRLQKLGSR